MTAVACCDEANGESQRVERARASLPDDAMVSGMAAVFKVLADETRVRIISALVPMELCVGELAEALEMSVSAVSHQLRLLRRLRVVKRRRLGRRIYYSLDDDHIEMMYDYGLDHCRHA